jgi:hypothetical protein
VQGKLTRPENSLAKRMSQQHAHQRSVQQETLYQKYCESSQANIFGLRIFYFLSRQAENPGCFQLALGEWNHKPKRSKQQKENQRRTSHFALAADESRCPNVRIDRSSRII